MKEIFEAFAPSGRETQLSELLETRLKGKFDSFSRDNMGNLEVKSGSGDLCIECSMDSLGVMVVSKGENGVRFSPVGELKVKDIVERTVVFQSGASGEVCCDEEKDIDDAKLSDLYVEIETDLVSIGEFGAFASEFDEDECAYCGFGIGNRIGLAAVCRALESVDEIGNVTVLFSAQKRLGGRGLRAYFCENSFERIVTVDKSDDDGCVIVAKDARAVSNRELRMTLENIAEKRDVLALTAVSGYNFCLEHISISCGDPCAAIGIGVMHEVGSKDRINKSDFDAAVSLLTGLLKGEG